MRSDPITDPGAFGERVERNSGEYWTAIEHVAGTTRILAGPDGPSSSGIYCLECRFGFRIEANGSGVRSARAHLRGDFDQESRRRQCLHWEEYVDHLAAFFYEESRIL